MQADEHSVSPQVIATLNDKLRSMIPLLPLPHRLVVTPGIRTLSSRDFVELFHKVRTFNNFTAENDPYQEHDSGRIQIGDHTCLFKFDYFDSNFEYFEENGIRVLTLMLAEEY